ncbi:hypothetical protein [Flammeovirga sp. SubArs3]|uniref:hypothetical protein n=1 Tax=Flammeovirga sp. SubArs3 TaxID=2995316 RepID=UPI00248BF400|nr:hypothetical protein [Flammeovirga sp. SubArs3]
MKHYHVLNGDSSFQLWKTQDFGGDPIIFREMLVEGDQHPLLWSEGFFDTRRKFFLVNYKITNEEYNAISFHELSRLQELQSAQMITLWFENDLFCYINLFAVLSYINSLDKKDVKVSLVLGDQKKGLGEYKPEDYPSLYNNRVDLKPSDIQYAGNFWKYYVNADFENLIQLIKKSPSCFPYIDDIMKAYMEQFPWLETGLSKIERRILKFLYDEPCIERKLIGKLLRRQSIEGFGDLQYERIIKQMKKDLLEVNEDGYLILTSEGKNILRGVNQYNDQNLSYQYIGGALRSEYYYDQESCFLIERN